MDWSPIPRPATRDYSRRRLLQATGVGMGLLTLGVTNSVLRQGRSSAPPKYEDIEVIREGVWVETETDTDNTGELDRTHVDIVRPTSTTDDPLPVILRADPYDIPDRQWADPGRPPIHTMEEAIEAMETELYVPESTDREQQSSQSVPAGAAPRPMPFDRSYYYEQQLLPEGYVMAYASPIGTGLSTGCSTLGGAPEINSIKAVIDWFNGRATAYRHRSGNDTVTADWTTGTTGMIGGSYRGALAKGVAATGVDDLETIVPLRAIANWYTYVRSNGAVISTGESDTSAGSPLTTLANMVTTRMDNEKCDDIIDEMTAQVDRQTGNYNDFWDERNYLADADQIQASSLLVHGMYDTETRPRHAAEWLATMREHDVPYKAWIHQGGHDDPREHTKQEAAWVELVRRWFEYWLKGVDNGVMDRPTAIVETPDDQLVGEADWPSPRSEDTMLRFTPGDGQFGRLDGTGPTEPMTDSFVNDSSIPPTELLGETDPEHRLVYRSEPLEGPLRLSGTPRPEIELSFDTEAALVSGAIVDYGPQETTIVNRGWMNPLNRNSLKVSEPLEPGEQYLLSFPMEPIEYVFEPGHRLGFMLYSSDHQVTKRPPSTPELTLHLTASALELPLVDGIDGFERALAGESNRAALFGDSYEYAGVIYEMESKYASDAYDREVVPTTDDSGDNGEDEPTQRDDDDSPESPGNGAETNGETDDTADADDDGSGFGIGGALASVGGLGYLAYKNRQGNKNGNQNR